MLNATNIAIAIAVLSLAVSATQFWFTSLRRGQLRMTTSPIIFFGYEYNHAVSKLSAKIILRPLLYSTSAHGKVIESMYVRLLCDGNECTFSFWGYGVPNNPLTVGGLYVGQTGVAAFQHFLLPSHTADYQFEQGSYTIDVFARLVSKTIPLKLARLRVALSADLAAALAQMDGVLFELDPGSQVYRGHRHGRLDVGAESAGPLS